MTRDKINKDREEKEKQDLDKFKGKYKSPYSTATVDKPYKIPKTAADRLSMYGNPSSKSLSKNTLQDYNQPYEQQKTFEKMLRGKANKSKSGPGTPTK